MTRSCLCAAALAAAVAAGAPARAETNAPCAAWTLVPETRTFDLVYASPVDVAEAINAMWCGSPAPAWGVRQVAVAMPDVNALAVTGPRPVVDACAQIVARYDRRPRQVYVEARFVSLSSDAAHKLGIHWGVLDEIGVESAKATISYTKRDGDDTERITASKVGDVTYTTKGYDYAQNTAFSGVLNTTQVSLLLSAIEGSDENKTFSNPKVIVTSGREATVDMTTKRPNVSVAAKRVVNGSSNSLDTDMRLSTIPGVDKLMFAGEAFFSWGVQLKVLPRVTTNGLVSVRIVPTISEVNEYVTVESSDDDSVPYSKYPIIDMQRIVSEFTMKSGMTAVIGGLSKTEEIDVETGIPWLQDIPWIGNKLFGYRGRQKVQREIIVFVTVGIADPEEMKPDVGLPRNAVLGRQFTNGLEQEPGDRANAVRGVKSLDLRDLDERGVKDGK